MSFSNLVYRAFWAFSAGVLISGIVIRFLLVPRMQQMVENKEISVEYFDMYHDLCYGCLITIPLFLSLSLLLLPYCRPRKQTV